MKKFYINQVILLTLAFFVNLIPSLAQKECGFERVMEQAKQENPYFEQARQQVEAFTRNYASNASERTNTIIKIPTVVHVVHNGEAVGTYPNMSDAQILSGIVNLNQAFQNTAPYNNTSYYNSPMNVEFILAKVSPTGTTTTGIERHDVTSKSYGATYDSNGISSGGPGVPSATLFADYYWNPQDYMNIWLVKKIDGVDTGSGGSGTLGYATLPLSNPGVSDGLVCQARAFGYYVGYNHNSPPAGFDFGPSPSHLNGTADHEVGHYLNLHHTFVGDNNGNQCPAGGSIGNNDDGCDDIPAHKRTNSECPAYSATGNECGGGSNEYIHNFMNYSTDQCFQGFSTDQKTRCEAAVNGPRSAFKTAVGHLSPTGTFPPAVTATVNNVSNPTFGINDISLAGVNITSQNVRADGGYLDRTASQPTLVLSYGTQYTMTVQVGVGYPQNGELVNVYIDYNGDNAFNQTDERVYQTPAGSGKTNGGVFTFTFTTPTNTNMAPPPANQRLRMRIISDFDNGGDPITIATNTLAGQIEDYSVSFGAILPVDMSSFNARPETKNIALDWETSSEQNNEGFEIQRSIDNRNFTTIDFVRGAGTTDIAQVYTYDDNDVSPAQLYYYRLYQKDYDGQGHYTEVVSARIKGDADAINVYPNPASSWLTVEKVEGEGTLEFEIFNTLGVKVLSSTSTEASQRVNVQHLPLGNYYIRVKSKSETATVKKVVLGL